MKFGVKILFAAMAAWALCGCGGDSSDSPAVKTIQSMRFGQTSYSVEPGKSITPPIFLRYSDGSEVEYNNSITGLSLTWESADISTATVSTIGVVTGVKVGTTTLTLRSPSLASPATTEIAVVSSIPWIGEWVIESWKGDASMAGKVYLGLTANATFSLYQNINSPGFTNYVGSYMVIPEADKNVLSGVYSDQAPWAEKYSIIVSADKAKLTATGLTSGLVSVYARTTIPPYVKSSVRTLATGESEKRFL